MQNFHHFFRHNFYNFVFRHREAGGDGGGSEKESTPFEAWKKREITVSAALAQVRRYEFTNAFPGVQFEEENETKFEFNAEAQSAKMSARSKIIINGKPKGFFEVRTSSNQWNEQHREYVLTVKTLNGDVVANGLNVYGFYRRGTEALVKAIELTEKNAQKDSLAESFVDRVLLNKGNSCVIEKFRRFVGVDADENTEEINYPILDNNSRVLGHLAIRFHPHTLEIRETELQDRSRQPIQLEGEKVSGNDFMQLNADEALAVLTH